MGFCWRMLEKNIFNCFEIRYLPSLGPSLCNNHFMAIQNEQRTQGSHVPKHKEYKAPPKVIWPLLVHQAHVVGKKRLHTFPSCLSTLKAELCNQIGDVQYPTNNKSKALHGDRREIGGEGNSQNQRKSDSDLRRKLLSAPELFCIM